MPSPILPQELCCHGLPGIAVGAEVIRVVFPMSIAVLKAGYGWRGGSESLSKSVPGGV
jgi:hypothetical protein